MDMRHVFCHCGSTSCMCQDGCCCSPPECYCSTCRVLTIDSVCVGCGHLRERLRPMQDWIASGRYHRDLESLAENVPHSREIDTSQASTFTRESEIDDDHDDHDDLMFQMDDIDEPPKNSACKPASNQQTNIKGFSGISRPSPSITLSNPRQLQTSQTQRIAGLSARSQPGIHANVSRAVESEVETSSQVNPSVTVSKRDQSQVSKTSITRNSSLRRCSCSLSRSKTISIPKDCNITEIPATQDLRASSKLDPSTVVSKSDKSQVTESPSTEIVLVSSELNQSRIISTPEDSNATVSPINKDLSGSTNIDQNKIISNPGELQVIDNVSGALSSPSNVYSSESLPSGLSSDDDSKSSHSSVTKSPTYRSSASAPPRFDVPEPFIELKSSKQETSKIPNSSAECIASDLPGLITDSDQADEKTAPSELSLSIETLSLDMNLDSNVNDFPQLHFSVNPSALIATSTVVESPAQNTALIQHTSNSIKIPSMGFSKDDDGKRKSSELSSSIETLSTEPANENYEGEPSKNVSTKK